MTPNKHSHLTCEQESELFGKLTELLRDGAELRLESDTGEEIPIFFHGLRCPTGELIFRKVKTE